MQKKKKKKIQKILNKQLRENKSLYIKSGVVIAVVIAAAILLINLNFSKAVDTSTLLSDQVVDDLKFMNASFESNKLTVVVYNTLESSYSLGTIDVIFQDENYNEITTVKGYIGESLEQKGMKQLVVATDVDLTNASHIKYVVNK